jgi:Ca2+-binding EF-hand superfamily protein
MMKTSCTALMTALALGASAWMANAQGTNSPPPQGERPPLPPSPLFAALDVNHDGVIDSNEIANASAALKTLDKNGDGQLTSDELRPQFGPGGPGGEGAPPPPPDPIMSALDVNHDGVIDASEIANASAALKTLDKNGDGQLTLDEIYPQLPGGQGDGCRPPPEHTLTNTV